MNNKHDVVLRVNSQLLLHFCFASLYHHVSEPVNSKMNRPPACYSAVCPDFVTRSEAEAALIGNYWNSAHAPS
jgi:hypothetical protein